MDIVHHALIGGAVLAAASGSAHETAAWAFVAATVMPDLDVAFMAMGKRFYLRNHQGITHSLILSPLFALAIAWLIGLAAWDEPGLGVLFGAALAGLWLHAGLDFMNTFGISLLWPASKRRMSRDAVFFIDSVVWALTLGFYLVAFVLRPDPLWPWFAAYAGLFLGYLAGKVYMHRVARLRTGGGIVIPSALVPWRFHVLEEHPDGVVAYGYDLVTGKKAGQRVYTNPSAEHRQMAEQSQVYRDMQHVARRLFITGVDMTDGGTTITAHDIAVPNFGGTFGRTVLRFGPHGELLHETANI